MAERNKVLIWAAILINGFELIKIITCCIRADAGDITPITKNLPLFLCSIQLITIPLAAFSRGRVKEAALDFVLIFGPLGGILGTMGAAQNYNAYPVLSWPNLVSATTHCISLFAGLYIAISGMSSMKKKNMGITFGILAFFTAAAMIANHILDYNYMFLVRSDGTPYEIFYQLVNGDPILYPTVVILLFVIYIIAFNGIFNLVKSKSAKKAMPSEATENREAVSVK
jgi:uncharacterized membrane protein YwaF